MDNQIRCLKSFSSLIREALNKSIETAMDKLTQTKTLRNRSFSILENTLKEKLTLSIKRRFKTKNRSVKKSYKI